MAAGNIGFIGGGNMAGSLVAGLLESGFDPAQILVADIDTARLSKLAGDHGVKAASTEQIGAGCELIVLAVKPNRWLRPAPPWRLPSPAAHR